VGAKREQQLQGCRFGQLAIRRLHRATQCATSGSLTPRPTVGAMMPKCSAVRLALKFVVELTVLATFAYDELNTKEVR